MNMMLGNLNANARRRALFKPASGNESLQEINNSNGAIAEHFAYLKIS
jgi:hypothetical protein